MELVRPLFQALMTSVTRQAADPPDDGGGDETGGDETGGVDEAGGEEGGVDEGGGLLAPSRPRNAMAYASCPDIGN
nr:hypothetical protein [Dactylosporangium matsuzakiense]